MLMQSLTEPAVDVFSMQNPALVHSHASARDGFVTAGVEL